MAFPRMSEEMVIAAHVAAHDFFEGLCCTGIYDNLKTVVTKIGHGKEREYNQRFRQLASHYLFEIRACTPAAGWEKGQIENQVKVLRQRLLVGRKFAGFDELNDYLKESLLQDAHGRRHPDMKDRTVWEAYQAEKPFLRRQAARFDYYVCEERRASMDCLVSYDRSHYSLPCQYAGKRVTVRAYSDKIVIAVNGEAVAEHKRSFQRGAHIFDPLHYLPLLQRKPGALRNGLPFREGLPAAIRQVWEIMRDQTDGEHRMVSILSTIPHYGLEAVEVACETALERGLVSDIVIINHLTRLTEDTEPSPATPPAKLQLKILPEADCARYDRLLGGGACSASNY